MPQIAQLHSASRVGALFKKFLGRSRLGIPVASFFVIAANVFCARADEFFETRIRPVLASECYECHGPEKQKGGLRLDYRDAALKGGETGPAVVPNDPAKSLLIQAITHENGEMKMPKKRPKLDGRIIDDFIAWVKMGAPDPRDKPLAALAAPPKWEELLAARRSWWSLQPVRKLNPPAPKLHPELDHPVDRFVAAKLEERGLDLSPPAGKRTIIRRLSFALIGLSPSTAEVERFLSDSSPQAYEHLVDRLLASPRFGERWARHWMDVVRYAETHGSEGDPEIPFAWRYRDYLIRALNADVPCDQLIREHIAGDLLPNPRWNTSEGINESMIGTAHFRFVEHGFQPVDALDDQVKVVENQIDVLGKAFQGLTLACARCHDHKFDAVSQRDFYALFGILASCRPSQVTIDAPERLRAHAEELRSLKEQIKKELADQCLAASQEIASQLLATRSSEGDSAAIEDQFLRKISSIEKELTRAKAAARERAFRRVRGDSGAPVPLALWTFDNDAKDAFGGLDGELVNGARIEKGKLILDGKGAFMRTSPLKGDMGEKTFEAWVTLSKRDQQGGGVITLQTLDGTVFDSIVFAEREPGRWVAGSEFFRRSRSFDGLIETPGPEELVHMAIVYTKDNRIAAYRNGVLYGKPYVSSGNDQGTLQRFSAGKSEVLLGLRHVGGASAFLEGAIDAAALYDRALSAGEIVASFKAGAPVQRTDEIVNNTLSDEKALRLTAELTMLRADFEKRFPDYEQKRSIRKRWMTAVQGATNQSSPLYLWNQLRLSEQNTNDLREFLQKARAQLESKPFGQTRWELAKLDSDKWFRSGINGPQHAATPGEFAIDPEGKRVISGIYPPGVLTHLLSQKHNGVFGSARFKVDTDYISVRAIGGKGARVRLIVENYPIGAEGIYPQAELKNDSFQWVRLDTSYRKGSMAYLEFATAEEVLSRTRGAPGPGGRSWFGVEAVVFHNEKAVPSSEPFDADLLYSKGQIVSAANLASRYQSTIIEAVQSWNRGDLTVPQQRLLDYLVRNDLLPNSTNASTRLAALVTKFRLLEADIPVARRAPGMLETVATDAALLERGDHLHPKEPVPRRYLEVLGSRPYPTKISGRLELANELASRANPLTARVMVNRIWHHLFGRGLVASVDNFGRLGETPSHPELLDYLAAHFVENGWSIKEMIRFLVSSRAYQEASEASVRAREIDPANELLSHMRVRRLEAESVRDSLLAISGRLDEQMFGPSVNALAPPAEQTRRSIYMSVRRTSLSPFLQVFDAPKPFTTIGRREPTNVPAQSLALLNDPFIIELANHWAGAVLHGTAESSARVPTMFEQAFARPPTEAELATSKSFLEQLRGEYQGAGPDDERVWRDFAQSLFNFKEFIYVK